MFLIHFLCNYMFYRQEKQSPLSNASCKSGAKILNNYKKLSDCMIIINISSHPRQKERFQFANASIAIEKLMVFLKI